MKCQRRPENKAKTGNGEEVREKIERHAAIKRSGKLGLTVSKLFSLTAMTLE